MDEAGIYARKADRLEKWVQLGVAGGRVISVSFPATPDDEARDEHPLLDRIDAYLDGEPDDFRDVTVALTVPTDQRSVLEALREVPYGETTRVQRLVRMTPNLDPEEADDVDLIRAALADNPAPLLIPDHRVEDATGTTPEVVAGRLRSIEAGDHG